MKIVGSVDTAHASYKIREAGGAPGRFQAIVVKPVQDVIQLSPSSLPDSLRALADHIAYSTAAIAKITGSLGLDGTGGG